MRNTLLTASLLVPALLTAGAYGQGMPRGRGAGRYGGAIADDDRSPSMSRMRTPSRSDRRRDDIAPRKPLVVTPPVRKVPPTRPPSLRPGVGSVPSGKRRADRGDLRDFLQLPGPGTRVIARPPSPPTRRPPTPPALKPLPAPTHRVRTPSLYQPPARVHKPLVYRASWNRRTPFTPNWYKTRVPPVLPRRTARYHPWVFGRPGYKTSHWWARSTAAALTQWLRHRWARPVYYIYGSGGNVFYQDDIVYVDGARYSTADLYYQQARAIALAAPDLDEAAAARLEWLPLGVFAVTRKGLTQTNSYIQLAVTREGIIGGTCFNEATGVSRPIEGTVDANTQRAAWTFADGRNTDFVVETSFYNLTQDEVPVLVHFGPGRTQEGLLIRTEPPAEG